MTSQSIDDLDHVFSHRTDSSFLNMDVLFVADQPEKNAFLERSKDAGHTWISFKQIVGQTLQAFRHKWLMNYGQEPKPIKIGMSYCSNRWLGVHPPYELLEKESRELLTLITNRYNPKVIIALGKLSSKILGVDIPTKKGRNKVYSINLSNNTYSMIPTFGFSDLNSMKFKCETHIRLDIMKAFTEVCKVDLKDNQKLLKNEISLHRYYRTYSQVKSFYDWYQKASIKEITIDFETTGLKYYKDEEKIILAAIGLGNKRAVTILLDHREHPEPENLPKIWDIVKLILEDDRVVKINHNIKFDYQMAKKHPYNIEIKNIGWCTQLAEHLCFEDKSNGYNLDIMTSEYEPVFENYKKMISPENKEMDQILVKLSKEEEEYTHRVNEWRVRKEVWESQKQFETQRYKDDLVVYKLDKKDHDSKVKEWENVLLPKWVKEVEEWETLPKKDRGPKPKKPNKPKIKAKKPKSPNFKEKKPQKTDAHKAYEERLKNLKKNSKDKTYEDVDLFVLEVYAAIDADVTFRIYNKQKVYMHQEHERYIENLANFYIKFPTIPLPQNYQRLEERLINTLEYKHQLKLTLRKIYPSTLDLMRTQVRFMPETVGDMEIRGSTLDYEKVEKMHTDMEIMKLSTLEEIQHWAKRGDINPNSDAEMRNLLNYYGFEKFLKERNLPREYTEQTKELSLAARFLDVWQDAFEEVDSPCAKILKTLAKYRKAHKSKDTYLSNYLEYCKIDGKIHTEFFIYGTSGARMSSGNPNLQNIPKKETMLGLDIKDLFIPTEIKGKTHVN